MNDTVPPERLRSGARLGRYELLAYLGAGGMGEVWRARDLTLDRAVALKLLPSSVRADRERLARFAAEARAAARLSHPNIMEVHELAEADGEVFIVAELLEGRTLRERLAAGALPWRKAVEYSQHICAGLGAAHQRALVHCDLKPDNLFVTNDDRIKILDFGLARLTDEAVALRDAPTATVTMQSSALLRGTVGYMAPEQARGAPCDARTDLFALGAIAYEMLSARRAFGGATTADTLGAILKDDPAPLPRSTPPSLVRIVMRCLEKEPQARFHSAHDLGLALEAVAAPSVTNIASIWWLPGSPRLWKWTLGTTALVGALALAFLGGTRLHPPRSAPAPVGFSFTTPAGSGLIDFTAAPLALTPDGQNVIFALADERGGSRLWRRRMDSEVLTPLEGTTGATSPFISPDGQSIAFAANGKLRRVSIAGGAAQDIADAQQFFGGCWLDDDNIVFAPRFAGGLWRVDASGSVPVQLTRPRDGADAAHIWPTCLPGSRTVLFTQWRGGQQVDDSAIGYYHADTRRQGVLVAGAFHPRYLHPGTLLFVRTGTLMAAPLDLAAVELTGTARPLYGGLLANVNSQVAFYETSNSGHLVFVRGRYEQPVRRLVWVDRHGKVEPASALRRPFSLSRIAPDGRRVATWLQDDGVGVWLLDLSQDRLSRLSRGMDDHSPVWSPDGTRVAFDSSRTGNYELYVSASDAIGAETAVTSSRRDHFVNAWLPDGRLAFTDHSIVEGCDLWLIEPRPDAQPELLLRTPFNESEPAFSADGRWMAYVSDDTRQKEVYVRRFPFSGPRVQVSHEGGEEPLWSRDGNELYFRNGRQVLAALVSGDTVPRVSQPVVLFEGRFHFNLYPTNTYDVGADGRFLMVEEPAPTPRAVHVVLYLGDSWRKLASPASIARQEP